MDKYFMREEPPKPPIKEHEHKFPADWNYDYSPAGSKTCLDVNCGYTIFD